MKKEIAEKWSAELRSGKYQQGTRQLAFIDGKFCCLGVLCEMAFQEQACMKYPDNVNTKIFRYDFSTAVLPETVQHWSGVQTEAGYVTIDGERTTLTVMNDNGKTFAEIADVIDQQYENL